MSKPTYSSSSHQSSSSSHPSSSVPLNPHHRPQRSQDNAMSYGQSSSAAAAAFASSPSGSSIPQSASSGSGSAMPTSTPLIPSSSSMPPSSSTSTSPSPPSTSTSSASTTSVPPAHLRPHVLAQQQQNSAGLPPPQNPQNVSGLPPHHSNSLPLPSSHSNGTLHHPGLPSPHSSNNINSMNLANIGMGLGGNSAFRPGSMILYRRADTPSSTPGSPSPFMGSLNGHHSVGNMGSLSGYGSLNMSLAGTATPPLLSHHHTGDTASSAGLLPPPPIGSGPFSNNRASVYSNSGDSIVSTGSGGFQFTNGKMGGINAGSRAGSVYGHGGGYGGERGLVAYEYDPEEDANSDDGDDDWLHDPDVAYPGEKVTSVGGKTLKKPALPPPSKPGSGKAPEYTMYKRTISWRGVVNITTLITMVFCLLALFIVYPIVRMVQDDGVASAITGNTRINATGQAVEGPDDVLEVNRGTTSGVPTTTTSAANGRTTRVINEQGVPQERRWTRWVADLD